MTNSLRSCAGCSAHILTNDTTSEKTYCNKCRPKYVTPFAQWAAALKVGDTVYVQPYMAWRGLSHSRYLIIERDVDELTLQIVGMPESRVYTNVALYPAVPRGGALLRTSVMATHERSHLDRALAIFEEHGGAARSAAS